MQNLTAISPISAATWQEQVVLDFIESFRTRWPPDLETALEPLAEDSSYQIVVPTMKPIRGRTNILAELRLMQETCTDTKLEIKAVGSKGNIVFTERIDHSFRNGKWSPVPLVAVFEINDAGKISAWREYLDLANTAYQHGISVEALCQTLKLER